MIFDGDEGEHFELGRGGLKLQHGSPLQRTKVQLWELEQSMVQSMTRSFPQEVWDACDIPHPEAAEKKGRLIGCACPTPVASLVPEKKDARRSVVAYELELEADSTVREEHTLAWLALQTGWNVIDVEEVSDVFLQFAVGGTVNVGGNNFKSLVAELCGAASVEDVRTLMRHRVADARAAHRRGARPDSGVEEKEISFSDFFVEFVGWLEGPEGMRVQKSCTLSRFQACARRRQTVQRKSTSLSLDKVGFNPVLVVDTAAADADLEDGADAAALAQVPEGGNSATGGLEAGAADGLSSDAGESASSDSEQR